MDVLRAFAADMALMFAELGQCIADAMRDMGRDIASPFKDAAWMRRERRRLERGE